MDPRGGLDALEKRKISCHYGESKYDFSDVHFHGNSGFANAPHWYVIHTLPVLFVSQDGAFTIQFVLRRSVLAMNNRAENTNPAFILHAFLVL